MITRDTHSHTRKPTVSWYYRYRNKGGCNCMVCGYNATSFLWRGKPRRQTGLRRRSGQRHAQHARSSRKRAGIARRDAVCQGQDGPKAVWPLHTAIDGGRCAGFMECCSAAELGPIAKRDRDEARALSRSTLWATYDSSRLLLSGLMCSADTAATDQAGTKRGSSRALLISSTYHVLTVSVVCSTD